MRSRTVAFTGSRCRNYQWPPPLQQIVYRRHGWGGSAATTTTTRRCGFPKRLTTVLRRAIRITIHSSRHDHSCTRRDVPILCQDASPTDAIFDPKCISAQRLPCRRGVTVGDKAVAGAGVVVRRDIPADAVAVPARVRCYREPRRVRTEPGNDPLSSSGGTYRGIPREAAKPRWVVRASRSYGSSLLWLGDGESGGGWRRLRGPDDGSVPGTPRP